MISVDDPGAFTTPWSALQRFRRVPREWSEDIDAENNFDFLQYEVARLPQAAKPTSRVVCEMIGSLSAAPCPRLSRAPAYPAHAG
jgi:hypothetical protein